MPLVLTVTPEQTAQTLLRRFEEKQRRHLEIDFAAMERLAARVAADRGPTPDPDADRGARAVVAVDLHQYYTALESALERVARVHPAVRVGFRALAAHLLAALEALAGPPG